MITTKQIKRYFLAIAIVARSSSPKNKPSRILSLTLIHTLQLT